MQLELTQDQEFFRETTHRFISAEAPIANVRALHDDPMGFDKAWWCQAAKLGWTAMLVGEDHGGGSLSGKPLADAVIVAEEIGRGAAPGPFLPVNVVASALSDAGAPGAHGALLAGIVAGDAIATWAFGESGSTWTPAGMTTTATPDGDHIIVDGAKAYVEAANAADHLLV